MNPADTLLPNMGRQPPMIVAPVRISIKPDTTRPAADTLVLTTAWPLAQIALVYTHDISPWKLAGWGMYAALACR